MPTRGRFVLQIAIASVALVLMLLYNFVHTGGLLASYVSPAVVGYLAAAGIELAVVGLSLQIGRRKQLHLGAGFFYFVLVSVVVVSALANMNQGHLQRYGTYLTVETVTSIDVLQGIIGIAATGLLSLIVMAMSEIVGQYMQPSDDRTQETEVTFSQNGRPTKTLQVQELAALHPEWTKGQLAQETSCSPSTVTRALAGHANAHRKGETDGD